MEGEEDALINLISIKMLRMNYQNKQSTNDCLEEMYRLKLHKKQTVEVECTTFIENKIDLAGVARTKSVIKHSRQNSSFDIDVSSGFYNIKFVSSHLLD